MKRPIITLSLLLTAIVLTGTPTFAASTGELLQQGLYAEEVEGNIHSAIKAYDEVARNASAPPNQIAQALYREGMCYLKLKDEASARVVLQRLVTDYSSQTEIVEKARPVLDELTDFDPATLMPPGTLVYVELGSPGHQVETVLNMLKGTAFENPLAAIGGQQTNHPKSPGDIVGALLNPSMITEFKKIRGAAVGITGVSRQNPPMIFVLYPGKSDALRGVILAALGVAGTPGQPMEGMQTINIKDFGAMAYDDKVFIAAHPASQLEWCVKEYKGLISEPTLASSNPSFARLSEAERQKNCMTVWANVGEAYAQLLKQFPAGQIPPGILSANAFVDFSNIDELTLVHSLETNGLVWKADLTFKDGHHCLAYNLIRTPHLSRAGLKAVPAEAIALASFSLSQADPGRAEKVRAEVRTITGLDLGREIFANIEQVTIFAMPTGNSASSTANGLSPDHLGLAITSRNPEQTRQVLATILGTMSRGAPERASAAAAAASPESVRDQSNASVSDYKISRNGREIHCYVGQVDGTTVLSLNREIVNASVAAIKHDKSVCAAGALNSAVNQLTPTASKLVLANVGGIIRLLGPQTKPQALDEKQARQFNQNLEQLAQAADATTIELRTDEQPNKFSVNVGVTGIPPLNQVVGPATQIAGLVKQIHAEAAARKLRLSIPAIILPATRAPVIDGKVDDVWRQAPQYQLANVIKQPRSGEKLSPITSSNDLSAGFRALWDENNLYLLVDVTDDKLVSDTDPNTPVKLPSGSETIPWWYDDSVEVYLDADNAKAPNYGKHDDLFRFNWGPKPVMRVYNQNVETRLDGVNYAMVKTDKGYRLEASFPWKAFDVKPSTGASIGLDVHVNDDDNGGPRDHEITWHDTTDDAWQSPQAFGNGLLAGLVGWWKFDETTGTIARDSSGNGHDGTLVGNAKWAPGKIGGAIDLDGHNSYVRIADKSAFDMAKEVSVACWVNFRSVPVEWTAIVTKGDSAWRLSTLNQERKFHMSVNDYNRHDLDAISLNGTKTVNADEWHHVTGVYDGKVMKLYVDGKLDATKPWTGGIARNNLNVLIGENAEQKGRCFDGLIDDVRIYNYALSQGEIEALAAAQ